MNLFTNFCSFCWWVESYFACASSRTRRKMGFPTLIYCRPVLQTSKHKIKLTQGWLKWQHGWIVTLDVLSSKFSNVMGSGRNRKISCESLSSGLDSLHLAGSRREIIEICVNWSRHPWPSKKESINKIKLQQIWVRITFLPWLWKWSLKC